MNKVDDLRGRGVKNSSCMNQHHVLVVGDTPVVPAIPAGLNAARCCGSGLLARREQKKRSGDDCRSLCGGLCFVY